MALSTYAGNLLLNYLRGAAPTAPAGLYLSLHTADPGATGASEVTGSGYTRTAMPFGAAASKAIANSTAISQGPFTGAVGPVTYWGLWDASTAGNFLLGGSITTAKTYASGDTATEAVGAFNYSLS